MANTFTFFCVKHDKRHLITNATWVDCWWKGEPTGRFLLENICLYTKGSFCLTVRNPFKKKKLFDTTKRIVNRKTRCRHYFDHVFVSPSHVIKCFHWVEGVQGELYYVRSIPWCTDNGDIHGARNYSNISRWVYWSKCNYTLQSWLKTYRYDGNVY